MKILLVNSYFPPWRGGAETYVYNLAKQLRERGNEIRVICARDPPIAQEIADAGLKVQRLRVLAKLYGTPIMPELPLRLAREAPEIVHTNFPSPFVSYFCSFASTLLRVPAVLTWHNDLPPVTPVARGLVTVHDRMILPSYLRRFSFIIATSEIYAKSSPILSRNQNRIVVIPNGVDTGRFNPVVRGDDVRARLSLVHNKVILFVGSLTRWHAYKGLDVLLEAMAHLKNLVKTKLVVVGGGELMNSYIHLARTLSVLERVVFTGEVSDDELPRYYACSDVFVLPSKDRSEGFGLTVLEANSAGKPAIGTSVGGIPSIIRDGYNGFLVPPLNSRALAVAIERALADDRLLEEMGRNGRTLAERYDWSIVAERTENLYRIALSRHSPRE